MRVASVVRLRVVILFRMSHFGMNPVRGGRPARDRVVSSIISIRWGEVAHMVAMSLIVVVVDAFSMRKIGVVVIV